MACCQKRRFHRQNSAAGLATVDTTTWHTGRRRGDAPLQKGGSGVNHGSTTSTFSSTARQTAQTISSGNKFIRLVDGNELAQLMIRHGVGVVTEYTYEIKKLDENYFADED